MLPKRIMLLFILGLSLLPLPAEERPWRLQAMAGIPMGVGVSGEYAFLRPGRFFQPAVEAHTGMFPNMTMNGDIPVSITGSLDLGGSVVLYFRESGDGFYTAAGYDWTWARIEKYVDDSDSIEPLPYTVTSEFQYHSVHLRAGWRWIWRWGTVALDGGYGMAFFDGDLPVMISADGKEAKTYREISWYGSSDFVTGLVVRLCAGVAL